MQGERETGTKQQKREGNKATSTKWAPLKLPLFAYLPVYQLLVSCYGKKG